MTLEEFVVSLNSCPKDIYIYGAGEYGDLLGQYINGYGIEWQGYIDQNPTKFGKILNGKRIWGLKSISTNNIVILISVLPVLGITNEIYNTLLTNNICGDSIIKFSENDVWVRELVFGVRKPEKELKRLINLKNIYEGKRCFVLGNGPSLKLDDLKLLKNDLTFGCNTIYQLFELLDYKLTGLFFSDRIFISRHLKDLNDMKKLLRLTQYAFSLCTKKVYESFRDENLYFLFGTVAKDEPWFSEDIANGVCELGTSLFVILQIVAYMGIKEIYLLGVDFSFMKEIRDGKVWLNEKTRNHAKGMDSAREGIYDVDAIARAFYCVRNYAVQKGIHIYNATRGGHLEIFDRIDFDSLFEKDM